MGAAVVGAAAGSGVDDEGAGTGAGVVPEPIG